MYTYVYHIHIHIIQIHVHIHDIYHDMILKIVRLIQTRNKIGMVPTYGRSNSRTCWDPDHKASNKFCGSTNQNLPRKICLKHISGSSPMILFWSTPRGSRYDMCPGKGLHEPGDPNVQFLLTENWLATTNKSLVKGKVQLLKFQKREGKWANVVSSTYFAKLDIATEMDERAERRRRLDTAKSCIIHGASTPVAFVAFASRFSAWHPESQSFTR